MSHDLTSKLERMHTNSGAILVRERGRSLELRTTPRQLNALIREGWADVLRVEDGCVVLLPNLPECVDWPVAETGGERYVD